MAPEDISTKELMLMFLDRSSYEARHMELQRRLDTLEREMRAHIEWAGKTVQSERELTNKQFEDHMNKIADVRENDWQSAMAAFGWVVVIVTTLGVTLLNHLWH